MSAKRRILFVDDEPNILSGLRRMLRSMRNEWDMYFATNGQDALQILEKASFDVVVSDMRMPGMDGAALLTKVMELYPETVRFVLSGQSDRETILRSIGPTHQFMSKPCDPETLKNVIIRAFAIRNVMTDPGLKKLVSQVDSLPSLPTLYQEVTKELKSEDPSIEKIGNIISSDVGMTAKILQLVNSAFFGLPQTVASPAQAVNLLGLDIIRSLVLVAQVFSETNVPHIRGFSIDTLQHHSLAVGAFAQRIAAVEATDKRLQSEAFMAGTLHDMGKLILASVMPEQYAAVTKLIRKEKLSTLIAEEQIFETNHANVGAYLLGLWGFPDPISESVVFHHTPSACIGNSFTVLTAVHAANCLIHEEIKDSQDLAWDMEYLERLGLSERIDVWREKCRETAK